MTMLQKPEHERMAVHQRSTEIQTSRIFWFPLELFLEIFSYLADHRQFIRENFYGKKLRARVEREHAERSIVIRRLTMTCWPLRNMLLPLLWADAEGCVSHTSYDYWTHTGGSGYSLYAQCVYLISNPTIAAYVQTFSVELCLSEAPEDLLTRFVDCLVWLSNLKTLEILEVFSQRPVSKTLESMHATFPSIRALRITHACHHFIRNCPNLEDLTFATGLDSRAVDFGRLDDAHATVRSHGERLKRISGVHQLEVRAVVTSCPNLREIGIFGTGEFGMIRTMEYLRQLKYLAIVGASLFNASLYESEVDRERARKTWKMGLVGILKDSPSTDRKVLRWKIVQPWAPYKVLENEESEVLPEMSL